jgi:hypothetical protein
LASGTFNVDPYDDLVSIWYDANGIEIMMPMFDTTQAMWTNSVQSTINVQPNNRIYVRTGDFDGDSLDEFIVAYVKSNDSIYFNLYDVDSTDLTPTLITTFSDEKLNDNYQFEFNNYFIQIGDVNGDGKDEILLQGSDGCLYCSDWSFYLKIYEVEGNSIVPKARKTVQPWQNNLQDLQGVNLSISTGQFKNDEKQEIAFICILKSGMISHTDNAIIYLLEASPDLSNITFNPAKREFMVLQSGVSQFNQLSSDAGDLNNDGRDELVFTTESRYYVLATDDDLNLTQKVNVGVAEGGPLDYTQSYNFLKVSDVNQDAREDIIITKNLVSTPYADGFFVAMITANNDLDSLFLLGRLFGDEPQSDTYQMYSIQAGNFDGYNFNIGEPTLSTAYGIVQPIVIINAPPVHFDKFGNDIFDVNGCYNGGNCDFTATYQHTNGSTYEVSTKVHNDWMISAGLSISGDMGEGATVNYEAHLLGKFGRHFSKSTTNVTTLTADYTNTATDDDIIYSTVADYDFWEYPVFHGNETFPRRSFLVAVPKNPYGTWFPSKSYNAFHYIPNHEVGNILSYYAEVNDDPDVEDTIRAWTPTVYTIYNNSNIDWELTWSNFLQSQADTVKENGFSYGVNFFIALNYDYSNTTMVTNTTTVRDETHLTVHLGGTNPAIPETNYDVLPYVFWATNDALVVNYAVNPELGPGGFETWWQVKYGHHSDPTFVLPWKLDPEKGYPLINEDKRFLTKDIVFSDNSPDVGDTLTITSNVRNFSLLPTPTAVTINYYLQDPDSGGTPIIGVNGTNVASTIGPIFARGKSEVDFKWVIPSGLPQYPQIYAVLDQGNTITEIHEENNKGFNVLGVSSVSDVENENIIIPEEYVLYQSYPNPFNPSTTIKYSIPNSDKVNLKVYDILGREVATLVNEYKIAGTYSVEFNASRFASGVYFYLIQSGNFIETRKMILLK